MGVTEIFYLQLSCDWDIKQIRSTVSRESISYLLRDIRCSDLYTTMGKEDFPLKSATELYNDCVRREKKITISYRNEFGKLTIYLNIWLYYSVLISNGNNDDVFWNHRRRGDQTY